MDESIQIMGQVASDLVLSAPIVYEDASSSTQSLVLDLVWLLGEHISPAGLSGNVSGDAVAMLARFIFAVFSIEYRGQSQQRRVSIEATATVGDGQDGSPRASTSAESEPNHTSRTPPRSPLIPDTNGENFQARSLPPHVSMLVVDEQSNPIVQRARAYFDALWERGYHDVIINQLNYEVSVFLQLL